MSIFAFDPWVLGIAIHTLPVDIGNKTRNLRTKGLGGQNQGRGQEQALDRQGVQEFV